MNAWGYVIRIKVGILVLVVPSTTTTSILCTFPRVPFYVSFVPEPHLKQKRKKVAMLPIDD